MTVGEVGATAAQRGAPIWSKFTFAACNFAMTNMTSIPYRKRNAITPGINSNSGVRTCVLYVFHLGTKNEGR